MSEDEFFKVRFGKPVELPPPLRSNYTGKSHLLSTNSLRTIDWSKNILLLPSYDNDNIEVKLSVEKHDESQRSFLLSGDDLLAKEECEYIIQTCTKQKLQKMEQQYDSGRNNSRLVVFDSFLAKYVWGKVETSLESTLERDKLLPFGFDILRGEWKLHGVNEAMRFNHYDGNRKEHFAVHRDSQFCPSGDLRSIFSLVIYLNDGFCGGETFYFPCNPSIESKGLCMSEEIDKHGGLLEGYEKIMIKPKCGSFVLFTPNILHESLAVDNNGSISNKYIIRTDVLMKRCGSGFGFSVTSDEQEDYLKCLNFFRDAQKHEMVGSNDKAGLLYERCLSIRYSYPTKQMMLKHFESCEIRTESVNREDEVQHSQDVLINDLSQSSDFEVDISLKLPFEVWLIIMKYVDDDTVQSLVAVFPHLDGVKRVIYEALIIPTVQFRDGIFTKFSYKSYKFVKNNIAACCRVLAIYSVYLLGHSPDNKSYTVNYNPETNTITSIPLEQLLSCVFYEKTAYGSVFKVRQQDQLDRKVENDFANSVDRNYMLLKYGKEFLGFDVSEEFRCRLKCICTKSCCKDCLGNIHASSKCCLKMRHYFEPVDFFEFDHSDSDESICELVSANNIVDEESECIDSEDADPQVIQLSGGNFSTLCKWDRLYCFYSKCPESVLSVFFTRLKGFKDYVRVAHEEINKGQLPYHDSLFIASNGDDFVGAAIIRKLMKPLKSLGEPYNCDCEMGACRLSGTLSKECETVTFNHLVIDFCKQKLHVYDETDKIEEDIDIFGDTVEDNCCWLSPCLCKRVLKEYEDTNDKSKIFGLFKVDIKAISDKTLSFNHASCQCNFPSFEVEDYVNLNSYPYLNHMHVLFVENENPVLDEEVSAWSCYGGIVAL